jgi:hypothetical protein
MNIKPEHSEFGGSIASRFLNCAGSTALNRMITPMPESGYASEGTLAHELAAHCLKEQVRDTSQFVDMTLDAKLDSPKFTKELCDAVQEYLDFIFGVIDDAPDAEYVVEHAFTIPIKNAEDGEVFGRNDCSIYIPSMKKLIVVDYKHGIGVNVDASDNSQGKFYAVGAAFEDKRPIAEVEVVIVQPRDWRNAYSETSVRRWTMDTTDLLEFKADLEDAVRNNKAFIGSTVETMAEDNAFKRGSWCTFCDAAALCPAAEIKFAKELALPNNSIVGVTPTLLPDPESLDVERLAAILDSGDVLEEWLGQVRQRVEALLLQGTAVPGWKVVDKQARAKIVGDTKDIVSYVDLLFDMPRKEVVTEKLNTLTELEKTMKSHGATKAQLETFRLKFTTKESSGRTIARVSDRREAVNAIATDFASVIRDG